MQTATLPTPPVNLRIRLRTALVASADEWHQTFLPNRTGRYQDVLLDCSGAIAMQLVVYIFMRTVRPKRLARAA